jgi:hypothetical protein
MNELNERTEISFESGMTRTSKVVVTAFSSLVTFLGSFERYGVGGSLFFISILLLVVFMLNWLPRLKTVDSMGWRGRCTRMWLRLERDDRWLLLGSVACLLAAVLLVGFGWANAMWSRTEYTLTNRAIPLEEVETTFMRKDSGQIRTQGEFSKDGMNRLFHWLAKGAQDSVEVNGVKKRSIRLVVARSIPFERNYDDIYASVVLSRQRTDMTICDAVVFLQKDEPDALLSRHPLSWHKPEYRQMHAQLLASKRAISVNLTKPNAGERVLLLIRVEYDDDKPLLQSDLIFERHELGVNK